MLDYYIKNLRSMIGRAGQPSAPRPCAAGARAAPECQARTGAITLDRPALPAHLESVWQLFIGDVPIVLRLIDARTPEHQLPMSNQALVSSAAVLERP